MSQFVEHTDCSACGSSDANAVFDDGHTYCFSCGARCQSDDGESCSSVQHIEEPSDKLQAKRTPKSMDIRYQDLTARGISKQTCEYFSYGVSLVNSQHVQVSSYHNATGKSVAWKLRTKDKEFFWWGSPKETGLFGQNCWKTGGSRLVITEGEIDAMTVGQALSLKTPVVSVPNGSKGAVKDIKKSIEFIESFDNIILFFDNDEPGREATQQVANLLTPGKVYIAQAPEDYKDANKLWTSGQKTTLVKAIHQARLFRPDGVVSGDELWEAIQKEPEPGLSFPWESLTKWTLGIRPAEMYIFGAGTGMGKTDYFKEIALHTMLQHGKKVGMLFLEEPNRDTALSLMSKHTGCPLNVPNAPITPEEKRTAYEKVVGNDRLFLYDHFGACDFPTIYSRIRYMVICEGVRVVFLDHLTALTDGESDERAVNQRMRQIVSKLAQMTRELNFTLMAISHLRKTDPPHEEGGRVHLNDFYGASAIKQWANFAFGIERNQQAEDPTERVTATLRCLKDRFRGIYAGATCNIRYNSDTTRQHEVGSELFQDETVTPENNEDF